MSHQPSAGKPSKRRLVWGALTLVLVALMGFPFMIRAIRMSGVPDLPEPFDLDAARRVEIPSGSNAFDMYRDVSAEIVSLPREVAEAFNKVSSATTWDEVPEEIRAWMETQRASLERFRIGSERAEGIYYQPDEMTINTRLDVTQQLRQMGRMAQLEALRLEEAGDLKGAWAWHRATLRASRHSGRHGCVIERLVGAALHGHATDGIVRWSARPGAEVALIRSALGEVREINNLTAPVSRAIQVEYLIMLKTITDPNLRTAAAGIVPPGADRLAWEARCLFWEPQLSQRTAKLVFTNWLSQCDLPRRDRAAVRSGAPGLFEAPFGGTSGTGGTTPERMQHLVHSAPIARAIIPEIIPAVRAVDRETARQALLETTLALQIWHREHGEFPESLEALVGKGLDAVPIDPFGKGEPIRYRRETVSAHSATVWSIGDDEVDDDGKSDIAKSGKREGDMVIEVKDEG